MSRKHPRRFRHRIAAASALGILLCSAASFSGDAGPGKDAAGSAVATKARTSAGTVAPSGSASAAPASKGAPVSSTAVSSPPAPVGATAPGTGSASAPAALKALPSVSPDDPGSLIRYLIEAFKTGKWAWGVGLLLMLLTWVFNKLLKERIPKKVIPWVAISLGLAGSIAMSFASGAKWYMALSNGLTMGLTAIGGWEAIGKLFKKTSAPTAAASATSTGSSGGSTS